MMRSPLTASDHEAVQGLKPRLRLNALALRAFEQKFGSAKQQKVHVVGITYPKPRKFCNDKFSDEWRVVWVQVCETGEDEGYVIFEGWTLGKDFRYEFSPVLGDWRYMPNRICSMEKFQ